jgi:hypothetical protein
MTGWTPDPAEWDAVTAAIEKDRDLSGIPYPVRALAFSALQALAERGRVAVADAEKLAAYARFTLAQVPRGPLPSPDEVQAIVDRYPPKDVTS